MKGWSRLLSIACALLFSAVTATAQAPVAERVALVIGNSNYAQAPLLNPGNDAKAMGDLLRKAGFNVIQRLDTTLPQLREAVAEFGTAIRDPKVKFGLFYYAGHGIQQEWRNYLIPVTAKIATSDDVKTQTVDVSALITYMEQAKGRSFLVILDACRDDPFAGTYKPGAKGLSQFDAPAGSLLAFATSPGNVAIDGEGDNGLYTGNLVREFAVPGAKVEDAFKRVRLSVRIASNGQQVPWESTSLEDDVYMFPTERKKLSEEEQEQALEDELKNWEKVKTTKDFMELATFIRSYPSGAVSELAQSRLNRLLKERALREGQKQKVSAARGVQVASLGSFTGLGQAIAQAEQQRQEQSRSQSQTPQPVPSPQSAQPQSVPGVVPPAPPAPFQPDDALVIAATPYYRGYHEFVRNYSVGDQFNYRVIDVYTGLYRPLDMKVTAADLDNDRVEYNGGEYVSDFMGNTTANQLGIFGTPRQFYPAEMFVGKKWRTTFRQSRRSGLNYTFRYDMKVVARETITVPAGTFDCFKIEARGFNMQLAARIERNIWVAPGVSGDIRHEILVRLRNGHIEQNDRQELVSFQQRRSRS